MLALPLSLSNNNDRDVIYADWAAAIVNSLNATVVSGLVFPAVSTSGGVGAITLAAVV